MKITPKRKFRERVSFSAVHVVAGKSPIADGKDQFSVRSALLSNAIFL